MGGKFRLLPTLRALFRQPSMAMTMIAVIKPWSEGLVLVTLLAALGGLVEMVNPARASSLDDLKIATDPYAVFEILFSPWWVAVAIWLTCPILVFLAARICFICGEVLLGQGSFASVLATQSFALMPAAIHILVSFVGNQAGVPRLGALSSVVTIVWIGILSVIGIRASLRLSVGKAIATVLSSLFVIGPLVVCLLFALFVVLYYTGDVQAASERVGRVVATVTAQAELTPTRTRSVSPTPTRVWTPTPTRTRVPNTSSPTRAVQGAPVATSPTQSPTSVARRATATWPPTPTIPPHVPDVLALTLNIADLAYDRTRNFIYVIAAPREHGGPQRILALDPVTGGSVGELLLETDVFSMALSDDDRFLYIDTASGRVIKRIDLASFAFDLTFPVYEDPEAGGSIRAFVVAPGDPETLIVAQTVPGMVPTSPIIAAYTNGVRRPQTESSTVISWRGLTACADSGVILGIAEDRGLYSFTLDGSGVHLAVSTPDTVKLVDKERQIVCVNGRLFLSTGEVIDPATLQIVGTMALPAGSGWMCADAVTGLSYFVGSYVTSEGFRHNIRLFDHRTLAMTTALSFLDVNGLDGAPIDASALRVIRWGKDGLAFNAGRTFYIVRSPLIAGKPAATAPAAPQGPPNWPFGAPVALAAVARRTRSAADWLPDRSAARKSL